MTTHDTLSTARPIDSELEQKRQAVLASMKKRSAANSRSHSPAIIAPPVVKVDEDDDGAKRASTVTEHSKLKSDLYDAILDLRALGFSFEKIVQQSGVHRDFLVQCYTEWKFPVPKVIDPPPAPIYKSATPIDNARSNSTTPVNGFQRPMFNNKVYRVVSNEKPEWLKNLVIDLEESSEEEESESESEHEEDDQDKNDVISDETDDDTVKQETVFSEESHEIPSISKSSSDEELVNLSKKIDEQNNKKRKLSNVELDIVKKNKKEINSEIKELSDQIKSKENEFYEVNTSIPELKSKLQEKENQLSWLKKQVENLENESNEIKETLADKKHEFHTFLSLKSKLANKLIELEDYENEEDKINESEKRRVELKEKLIQQMKLKKQRKVEELAQKEREEKDQQEQERQTETDNTKDNNKNDLVYADTIHKIPKAQADHFTPYHSLGLRKKTQNRTEANDNDQLCPIELINGKCDEKGCKFQHLSS